MNMLKIIFSNFLCIEFDRFREGAPPFDPRNHGGERMPADPRAGVMDRDRMRDDRRGIELHFNVSYLKLIVHMEIKKSLNDFMT